MARAARRNFYMWLIFKTQLCSGSEQWYNNRCEQFSRQGKHKIAVITKIGLLFVIKYKATQCLQNKITKNVSLQFSHKPNSPNLFTPKLTLTPWTSKFQSSLYLTHSISTFQSSPHLTHPTSTFKSSLYPTHPTSTFLSSHPLSNSHNFN